mmetsp:Transcript_82915/g.137170  ORF Transcript_82915/g.137170 Transcript_82915/m.137170 type:complete len:229 (+) Transcript_82915:3-689(+)
MDSEMRWKHQSGATVHSRHSFRVRYQHESCCKGVSEHAVDASEFPLSCRPQESAIFFSNSASPRLPTPRRANLSSAVLSSLSLTTSKISSTSLISSSSSSTSRSISSSSTISISSIQSCMNGEMAPSRSVCSSWSFSSAVYGNMASSMIATPSYVPGRPYLGSTLLCTVSASSMRPGMSCALAPLLRKSCNCIWKSKLLKLCMSSFAIDSTSTLLKLTWTSDFEFLRT